MLKAMDFIDALGNIHILPKGEKVYKRVSVYPVVFNNDNELLVYMPHYNPQWQLPGGGMDPDESAHQTAVRECLEETGYHIKITEDEPFYIGTQKFYKRGDKKFYDAQHLFFYAQLLSDKADPVSEEDKEGKVNWISLKDLNEDNFHYINHPVLKILRESSKL